MNKPLTNEDVLKALKQCLNEKDCAYCPFHKLCDKDKNLFDYVVDIINSLQARIKSFTSKQPVIMDPDDWFAYKCPNCNSNLTLGKYPHCHWCGQALDWNVTE